MAHVQHSGAHCVVDISGPAVVLCGVARLPDDTRTIICERGEHGFVVPKHTSKYMGIRSPVVPIYRFRRYVITSPASYPMMNLISNVFV